MELDFALKVVLFLSAQLLINMAVLSHFNGRISSIETHIKYIRDDLEKDCPECEDTENG